MTQEDILRRFFEEPGGHVVLDTDLRIVEVGPEYLRLTRSHREDLIGKLYMNTFTEPQKDRHEAVVDLSRRLASSVMKTHQPEKYGPIRVDVRQAEGGKAEERWWVGAYIPVVDDDRVAFVVHRIEDVTLDCISKQRLEAQRRSNYILYIGVLLALGIVTFVLVSYYHANRRLTASNHRLTVSTCKQVQQINSNLQQSSRRQIIEIHTPGTFLNRFFVHEHPELEAGALAETFRNVQIFAPKKC